MQGSTSQLRRPSPLGNHRQSEHRLFAIRYPVTGEDEIRLRCHHHDAIWVGMTHVVDDFRRPWFFNSSACC